MDAWLFVMAFVWGGNYSLVKYVVGEVPPASFNTLRLGIASLTFLVLIARTGITRPITGRDWLALAGLGLIGHFLYQVMFIEGVARTSATNGSLIIACTPVAVALLSARLGHERIGRLHWAGTALSALGVYVIVAFGAARSATSLRGDLLMIAAVACWTGYTVFAMPVLQRHSPLVVTGLSMTIGTLLYVPASWPTLRQTAWSTVSAGAWIGVVLSAFLALNLAYLIWYTAVQRIGSARTAIYSNMVPVAAVATAALLLGEPVGPVKLLGAAAVVAGVALTRVRLPAIL
jgi:drug/metabolite transporter (DMT)-like permease